MFYNIFFFLLKQSIIVFKTKQYCIIVILGLTLLIIEKKLQIEKVIAKQFKMKRERRG